MKQIIFQQTDVCRGIQGRGENSPGTAWTVNSHLVGKEDRLRKEVSKYDLGIFYYSKRVQNWP